MCLLALPRELAWRVLSDWLLDWRPVANLGAPAWKTLSSLDVAACGGKRRPQVLELLRTVTVDEDTIDIYSIYCYSLLRVTLQSDFVRWIETRGVTVAIMRLDNAALFSLAKAQAPQLKFLRGFKLYGRDDVSDVTRRRAAVRLLKKMPHLARLGLSSFGNQSTLHNAVLDVALSLHGPNLVTLCVHWKVTDAVLESIARVCTCLQHLTISLDEGVATCDLASFLRERGGQLISCRVTTINSTRRPHWSNAVEVRECLGHLTHPDLRCLEWGGQSIPLPLKILLEFVNERPRLQLCVVGPHSFLASEGRLSLGHLSLAGVDSEELDSALLALGTMPHLPLRTLALELAQNSQTRTLWLPSPSCRFAFAATHGHQVAQAMLTLGRGAEVFPILRLIRHLPSLQILRLSLDALATNDRVSKAFEVDQPWQATSVTSLSLSCFSTMTDSLLESVLLRFPSISAMSLHHCLCLTDAALSTVSTRCPGIRCLTMISMSHISAQGLCAFSAARPECSVSIPCS